MNERTGSTVYFSAAGSHNTARTLEIARQRAEALAVRTVLVASTTGETGVRAARAFAGWLEASERTLVIVTHSTGFAAPNVQELTAENRAAIEAAGGLVLTAQHAFGGVGRAVRKKLGAYQVDEIMAYTLRTFGEGIKVCAEMALMAADAGLVCVGQPTAAIAGAGRGADTAVVLRPANAQTFFDLRFLEVLCMPSPLA
ncbi:MAG: hypothetical protein ACOYZ7_07190 [Chloroflexota bacterium]